MVITVVDNSPDDALRSMVEAEGAQYIFAGKNLGFGAGHNLAIRRYVNSSEYHLILNPDTTFGPDTIPALANYMRETPRTGLVMPKVLYPNGTEQRLCKRLPTPFDLFARRFIGRAGHRLAANSMARYQLEDVDLSRPCFVPNLSGCFMFVRTEVLRSIGGFDERFFLYLEDVDLCRRIGEQWDTMYYPYACIVHEYGNGSYRNLQHLKLHTASAWRYFNKWGWLTDHKRDALNARIVKNDQ
jgi:GT2 family glycosyltransferase